MKYTIKQVNSKKLLVLIVKTENPDEAIKVLFKGYALQQKINRRFFSISKAYNTYLCYNEQPIHSAPFIMAKHTITSSVRCIIESLLPEFESLRPNLEPLRSIQE